MGSYRLVEKIGQGGMGEVWRAEHRLLAREAAIKLIAPVAGAESLPVIRQRFEREARAIAALASPHTVTLFDYGVTEEGRLYYVMELLRGIDLEELVERYGPLPPERAAFLLLQMCASLEEAHSAGLTHRDIKPRNVLVSRLGTEYDFVKLLDFGLVKSTGAGEAQLTKPESTAGTPAFMAPETAMGGAVDSRADIYSLGCTGYWLLTGRLVFEGKTPTAILMEHVRAAPMPPSQRVETAIPAGLEALILECLAKEPGARPQGAGELRGRLEEWARDWPRARSASWWKQHRPV
jgi:eukaryotic-like serine/threonine-protein kinase